MKENRLSESLDKLLNKKDLGADLAYDMMDNVLSGAGTPVQVAAVLTALKMKGETIDEIYGCAKALREHAKKVTIDLERAVDTCGTGGDGSQTFNISTTAAFIAAACGVKVAKHGNRSVTSLSGSADVLEQLGLRINNSPSQVERSIEQVGVGFLFAPLYHEAMKNVGMVRKELGFRTVFNILGPLCNPARVERQIIGVYEDDLVLKMAHVLHLLGVKHALVVHGSDGLDEITLTGNTRICEVKEGNVTEFCFDPREIGIEICDPSALTGGDVQRNAALFKEILSGVEGPAATISALNAGASIYVSGLAESIEEGYLKASEALKSGQVMAVYEQLLAFEKQEGA